MGGKRGNGRSEGKGVQRGGVRGTRGMGGKRGKGS